MAIKEDVKEYKVEDIVSLNIIKEKAGISLKETESKDININIDKLLSSIDKFLINYKN